MSLSARTLVLCIAVASLVMAGISAPKQFDEINLMSGPAASPARTAGSPPGSTSSDCINLTPGSFGVSYGFTTCGEAQGASVTFSGTNGGNLIADTNDPYNYVNYGLTVYQYNTRVVNVSNGNGGYTPTNDISYGSITAGVWEDRGPTSGPYGLNNCHFLLGSSYDSLADPYGSTIQQCMEGGNGYITCAPPVTGNLQIMLDPYASGQWDISFNGSTTCTPSGSESLQSTWSGSDIFAPNLIWAGVQQRCACFSKSPPATSNGNSPRVYTNNLKFEDFNGYWQPWGIYSHCLLRDYRTPYGESFEATTWHSAFKGQLNTSLGTYGESGTSTACDGSANMPNGRSSW